MAKKTKSRRVAGRTMMDRWNDVSLLYKILMTGCGALIALSGAAVAWGSLGARRVVPAIIGYVDDTINDRVTPIITAQTKFESFIQSSNANQLESQLANAQGELTKWQTELPKTSNPQTRTLIQNRIEALQKQIPQIIEDISRLRGAHGNK